MLTFFFVRETKRNGMVQNLTHAHPHPWVFIFIFLFLILFAAKKKKIIIFSILFRFVSWHRQVAPPIYWFLCFSFLGLSLSIVMTNGEIRWAGALFFMILSLFRLASWFRDDVSYKYFFNDKKISSSCVVCR